MQLIVKQDFRQISQKQAKLLTPFDPDQLHSKQLPQSQGVVSFPGPFAELKAESKLF